MAFTRITVNAQIKNFYVTSIFALVTLALSSFSFSMAYNQIVLTEKSIYLENSFLAAAIIFLSLFFIFSLALKYPSITKFYIKTAQSDESTSTILFSILFLVAFIAIFAIVIWFKIIEIPESLFKILLISWVIYSLILLFLVKNLGIQLYIFTRIAIQKNKKDMESYNLVPGINDILLSKCPFCHVPLPWDFEKYQTPNKEFTCPACKTSFLIYKSAKVYKIRTISQIIDGINVSNKPHIDYKAIVDSTIELICVAIIWPLLTVGVVIYIINYLASMPKNIQYTSPLDISILAATLGGFALIGTFYDKAHPKIKPSLRRSGQFFLAAALFFTILFFLLQIVTSINDKSLTNIDWFVVVVTVLVTCISSFSLSSAVVDLTSIIFKLNDDS